MNNVLTCEECGESLQLVMDPEDYPKKVYAVLAGNPDFDPDHLPSAVDLDFFDNIDDAVLCSGHKELLVGEYVFNKAFTAKATVQIVAEEGEK